MTEETVTIIGAGIGGLCAALGLVRAGRQVEVYEQAPVLGEVGAGLSISPNASLGLGYLDMLDYMEAESDKPLWQYTRHGLTHEELVAIDRRNAVEQYDATYYQIHRADFHAELVRRVELEQPGCIKTGYRLKQLSRAPGGFGLQFDNGETVVADILIGADGLRSEVRGALFSDDQPQFTNYVAWRALIPANELPAWYAQPASHVWLHAGKNCVTYPIRKQKLINLVAFTQTEDWVEEGWAVEADPEEFIAHFEGWHEKPRTLIEATRGRKMNRWGLFARTPLDCLTDDNVALLGDAAHPMLPWFGQGASSSIEDGVVLARCFEEAGDARAALALYNKTRVDRVKTIQRESNLGGERLHKLDPYTLRDLPVKNEDSLGIFKYNPAQVEIA
ncbi:MAG: FAD-dependent monooxygenase [Pseudomonadota bacterium]